MSNGTNASLRPLLGRSDQGCLAIIAVLSLLAISGHYVYLVWGQGGSELSPERLPAVQFSVDINHAAWPELTLLPGVGETLARRIVESREAEGPFETVDQLKRVKGIGPKTVIRLKPYLLPLTGKTKDH